MYFSYKQKAIHQNEFDAAKGTDKRLRHHEFHIFKVVLREPFFQGSSLVTATMLRSL